MTAPAPRVVVTRPAAQSAAWVLRLQAAGIAAVALPLIETAPAADTEAVAAAWASLPSRRLVVFVSPNAVLHFFAARPADRCWPPTLSAATPGPGTAEALRAAGVAPGRIVEPAGDACRFDSEALWHRLGESDWAGASVLLVRGDGGRQWLAERLIEAGAQVDAVQAYRRSAPTFSHPERVALEELTTAADAVWLFTSSQAIDHLEAAAGAGRWHGARAIATHPRIAARARTAGFGRVIEAAPGLDALVACIQSVQP